ncbi:MAG: hypothetical protein R3246_11765, partial [Acidimicrobiia bacterium]|nr:hypothetical protein [Acidimicrobiia bacterium]
HAVALIIVAALAAFTVSALRPPSRAVVAAPQITTPPTTATSSVAAPPSTSTTVADRVAEIEAIVRTYYFGWFDGLYRNDIDAIDRVAGTEAVLEQGRRAMGRLEFTAAPTPEAIGVRIKKVLLDRPDCLVGSADIDFRSFVSGVEDVMPAVDVYFRVGDGWGRANSYLYEREMWQVDCDYLARR